MHITDVTYHSLPLISSPKIHTNLLWDLTLLFLILGTIYFVSVFFFRNKLSRQSRKTKNKREELAPIISNFLFHSSEDPKEEQKKYIQLKIEIREYLANQRFRRTISQILFDLQKDVAGDTRKRLFRLYKELELHHDAFQKLESWRWETVAQGILELSQMEVDESYQLIRKFINDRRGVIRKQAELATVGLRADGIDYVLDTTKHSISEWQQLKLIEVLGKRVNYRAPEFKGWLLSQNKDVVLFALRLIKHYNQNGAESSITELVKHKNDEIKIAAIQCIVDFNFQSALPVLKSVFTTTSNAVKISILNAIAILGSTIDIPYLKEIIETEGNFLVIGKAQSTINAIAPETILPTKDIVSTPSSKTNNINEGAVEEHHNVKELVGEEIPESIEVEDIEFYDEIEIPGAKSSEKEETESDSALEITTIPDSYSDQMDDFLGFVASEEKDLGTEELTKTYDETLHSDKIELVKHLGVSADERERPLLEHITANEKDSELSFLAFKKLKSLQNESKENQSSKASNPLGITPSQQSIFYALYHHTDELDAKLILLEELLKIGDVRDIPFLESLFQEDEKTVVKKAKEVVVKLSETIGSEEEEESPLNQRSEDEQLELVLVENSNQEEKDDRIPMELFLLYEQLGIAYDNKEEQTSPFDFELSEEFFLDLKRDTNWNKEVSDE